MRIIYERRVAARHLHKKVRFFGQLVFAKKCKFEASKQNERIKKTDFIVSRNRTENNSSFSAEQTVVKFKVSHFKRSLEAGLGLGLKGPGLKLKLAQNMTAT